MSEAPKDAALRPSPVERLGLRPVEVAESLGVSEGLVRRLLPEMTHARLGSAVVVPVDLLREWLRDQAEMERESASSAVREILEKLG